MQLFYIPDINSNDYTLSKEESKHCIMVLRKTVGDEISLIDGKGGFYIAKITEANSKSCQLEVISIEKDFGKSPNHIHLAIAPTKSNDRFEWFLEKATEIGINEITPIVCDNSERKVLKLERMNKILVSAMKQSKRAFLPKLNDVTFFKDFIQSTFEEKCFIAHCEEGEKLNLKDSLTKGENTLILIGPEGDFSNNEIKQAKEHNFTAVSLGTSRLRTETAGVVACHTVNLINQ
ncbi:16S rRNA (uracil(1498)-N(3))-methyltransferase [bacterium]|nr:16S rRNA (uracil(1498)-N(3))-methyltransferase [bacterium]MDB2675273.1 16S rRNA (uracil(1498)-N(3))-methyltransferase [Flavobacteriales bacterium]